jgi:hypothetical protein
MGELLSKFVRDHLPVHIMPPSLEPLDELRRPVQDRPSNTLLTGKKLEEIRSKDAGGTAAFRAGSDRLSESEFGPAVGTTKPLK